MSYIVTVQGKPIDAHQVRQTDYKMNLETGCSLKITYIDGTSVIFESKSTGQKTELEEAMEIIYEHSPSAPE